MSRLATRLVAVLAPVAVHLRDLEVRARHETLVRIWTPDDTFDVSAERLSARRGGGHGGPLRPRAVHRRSSVGAARRQDDRHPQGVYADELGTVFFLTDDGHRGGFRENSIGKGPRIRRG